MNPDAVEELARELYEAEYAGDPEIEDWDELVGWEQGVFRRRAEAVIGESNVAHN